MNSLNNIKAAFHQTSGGHDESHSLVSLSRRLLLSRQTLRKMLKTGELKAKFSRPTAYGEIHQFEGPYLDKVRCSVVEEIGSEIATRLSRLNASEADIALATLHSLRDQQSRIELAAKKPKTDDEEDDEDEKKPDPGDIIGNIAGAGIGGAVGSIGGLKGAVVGGLVGSAAGSAVGRAVDSRVKQKDRSKVADAAIGTTIGGGAAYIGHRAIQERGGYRAVGTEIANKTTAARAAADRLIAKAKPLADQAARRTAAAVYTGGKKAQRAAGVAQDTLRRAKEAGIAGEEGIARGARAAAAVGKVGTAGVNVGRMIAALRKAGLRTVARLV